MTVALLENWQERLQTLGCLKSNDSNPIRTMPSDRIPNFRGIDKSTILLTGLDLDCVPEKRTKKLRKGLGDLGQSDKIRVEGEIGLNLVKEFRNREDLHERGFIMLWSGIHDRLLETESKMGAEKA